jgi:hypothetical protein
MKLFRIICFVAASFGMTVSGQQGGGKSFIFNARNSSTEATKNKYDLLFLLTNGNPKQLSAINITYVVYSNFYLQKTSYSTSEIYLKINNIQVEGDTVYRSFGISSSLRPDCFEGKFTLSSQGEILQNKSLKLTGIALNQGVRIGYCDFEENSSTNIEGVLSDFNFSLLAAEELENRVNNINAYWACSLLVDSLKTEIDQNGINNSTDISELFVFWDKTRKSSVIASESINNPILGLDRRDPAGLIEKKESTDRLNLRFHTLLGNELDKLKRSDFNTLIAKSYLQSLQQYRISSRKVGFYDSNVFSEASLMKIDQSFVDWVNRFDLKDSRNSVAQNIYDGLKETGFEMFAKDDLAGAISIFTDLKLFEKAFPVLIKDPQVNEIFIKAKEGLLNSYLQIASRAMLANNNVMAAKYHHKAEEFRKRYYAEDQLEKINDNTGNLVSAYYEKGLDFINKNQLDDAILMLEKAQNTSVTFGNKQYLDRIHLKLKWLHEKLYLDLVSNAEKLYEEGYENQAALENEKALLYRDEHLSYLETSTEAIMFQRKMKQPVVSRSIETGISSAQQGKAKQALEAYNNARLIADEFRIMVDPSIDSLTKAAARPVIIETIRSANSKVWANDMNAALKIYSNAKEMQQKYQLESDSAIQDEFNRLDNKMIQQACFNCSKKYNELIQNIEKAIRQNRYDELAGNLQEAIELGEENRGCMLDLSKAKAFQIQYQKLLDYNKRYNEVMQAMYSQGFGTAISIYEKLDEDIALFSLDEYGITHLKIIQFVDNQNNSGLTRIALQYFLAKNDVQNAYACFTSLQKQTMDDNETEKIQISLAEQLARRDAESAQNISAEQLSLGYFGEDKRNRTLRQTYLKVFKSTQRM